MKKQYTNSNKLYESPRVNTNHQIEMERTKTLKKHNYFQSGMMGVNSKNKQAQDGMFDVLGQLASYVQEKNEEIPWTKKYNWQQMLVSSEKESSNENDKKFTKKSGNTVQQDESQPVGNIDEFVNFLLRINKKNSVQSFSNQKSLLDNIYNNESDSEDFDELMMFVERENKRKKQKQSQQLSYHKSAPFHQPNSSFFNNKSFQEINSPILARHRPARDTLDQFQSPDGDDSILQHLQNKSHERYLQSSEESSLFQQEESKQSTKQSRLKIQKRQAKTQNPQRKNNKSSSYKNCRLRKQRQQQTICTICMQQIQERGKLPCKHSFCLSCLKDWLEKTSSCPICRKDAKYYKHKDQKYKVEQKKYSLQNFIENIGDDSYNDESDEELDYECENCEETQFEDEILICDRCFVNATHIACDIALGGMTPPQDMNWYCSVCRQSPSLWFLQSRH